MTLLADKPSSPNFTVAQLIMELSTMPPDMVVLVERGGKGGDIFEIENVQFHHTDDENQVVILEVR